MAKQNKNNSKKESIDYRFSVGGKGERGKAIKAKYAEMRGQTGHLEFLEMLLSENLGLKFAVKGKTKAEMKIKTWIRFGHTKHITASELRKYVGVDLNTCKKVTEAYSEEISEHNKQFGM